VNETDKVRIVKVLSVVGADGQRHELTRLASELILASSEGRRLRDWLARRDGHQVDKGAH